MSTMDPNYNRADGTPPDYYELEKIAAQLRAENDALAGKCAAAQTVIKSASDCLEHPEFAAIDQARGLLIEFIADPTPAVEAILRDRERLKVLIANHWHIKGASEPDDPMFGVFAPSGYMIGNWERTPREAIDAAIAAQGDSRE